jgi:quinohemoprotein ethanol dehydrogenase
MTRLPRVNPARRFSSDTTGLFRPVHLVQAAVAIGFGLAISCGPTFAQNAAKTSPDHIRAVTSTVDGAAISANTATSVDWPTVGLDYAETRFSKLSHITSDNVRSLGLVWSYSLDSARAV